MDDVQRLKPETQLEQEIIENRNIPKHVQLWSLPTTDPVDWLDLTETSCISFNFQISFAFVRSTRACLVVGLCFAQFVVVIVITPFTRPHSFAFPVTLTTRNRPHILIMQSDVEQKVVNPFVALLT